MKNRARPNPLWGRLRQAFAPANIASVSLKDMWQEGDFTAEEQGDFYEVIDHQSDTTIVCFAGLALGFVGLPSYEFRKALGEADGRFNLIFIRDIRRFWYHLTPYGETNGLDFYTQQIQALVTQLKTRRLITVGVSAGGYAAMYFGWRLQADQVIAFSPQTDLIGGALHLSWVKLLINPGWSRPRQFLQEQLIIGFFLRHRAKLLKRKVSPNQWGILVPNAQQNQKTKTDVYYCQHNQLDRQQALKLSGLPGVTLHDCDCNLHNVAGYLRNQSQLFSVLTSHLEQKVLHLEPKRY
jgi:pimeloyl-ACP methyl ester carboxylesterase